MFKHNRSQFLLNDTHRVFGPGYHENSLDVHKEFAKHCHKRGNAIPISSIVIQDWFKDDLYALMHVGVTPEQSMALANSFKYYGHNGQDVKEICFFNNNMADKQFADLLTAMIEDEKQYNDLQRISYGGNNELGQHTMTVLDKLITEKHPSFPLTHLALVNCKKRIRTIEPLFKTLESKDNHLESLIIPHQNLGEVGFKVLCELLSQRNQTNLRVLDISWNEIVGHQITPLFAALSKNRDLEHLNLAMTSLHVDTDLRPLINFVKKNPRLLHIDFSGMFKTAQ